MVQEVQGSIPALSQKFFSLFQMDTEEIEVIKDRRPIGQGPFFSTLVYWAIALLFCINAGRLARRVIEDLLGLGQPKYCRTREGHG